MKTLKLGQYVRVNGKYGKVIDLEDNKRTSCMSYAIEIMKDAEVIENKLHEMQLVNINSMSNMDILNKI